MNDFQMVRWYLDDDDDDEDEYEDEYEDDLLKPERLLQRTDRGAGWHHVQQLMNDHFSYCLNRNLCNNCERVYDLDQNDGIFLIRKLL